MDRQDRLAIFGPFEVDLTTGEVRRNGTPVPLQQQPFKVLEALLARPGELVTRDELRRRLWPDGTYVAFDRGLTSAMRKVREALSDRADGPAYIETLPGRGYRFIAPVALTHAAPPTQEPLPVSWRAASRAMPARVGAAAMVALSLLAGGQVGSPAREDGRRVAAEALSAYACLLKSQGQVGEALRVIRQAHALAPESAKITAEVGFYLHASGQYEEEFPMLRRAIALDRNSPDAWFHLGLAEARRDAFDEAVAALERARALAADDEKVVRWLAWAREHQQGARGSS